MSDDRLAEFLARHGLPDAAREELEQMLRGYGMPVAALPDSHADSTLMVDPEEIANAAVAAGGELDAERAAQRYEDLGFIGRGAFAEVRRVRDKALNRVMAMKVLERRHGVVSVSLRARFVQEAQATAQLQHPAIVPVHELGALPDGRMFFTMEEVRGRTLSAVVDALHRASIDVWSRTGDGWTLRRLVEVFRRVSEAVAYAHSRGVVHRDLKPANVMVGAFGEVRVMDWGIAKILGSALATPVEPSDPTATRDGLVAGTPAFMAPEQARGEIHRIDRRTDVYALGSMLHYILRNAPPYEGPSSAEVLIQVARAQPADLVGRQDGPLLPPELVRIALKAMEPEPDDRYQDAEQLATDVADWLDGAERREAALRAVARAAEERRVAKRLQRAAVRLREAAARELDGVASWAPEDAKAGAWEKEDEAAAVEREALCHEQAVERELNAAFAHEADLPEGHLMMARMYKRLHAEAEEERDERGATRALRLLRDHLKALPPHWPGRGRLEEYLVGTGTIGLQTSRPAEAVLYRYETRNRRLVAVRETELGTTPLDRPVAMGSYLLELVDEAGDLVLYPFTVGRLEAVTHRPPGAAEPVALALPEGIDAGEAFVPAGWFVAGGDERAPYGLPERRLWCDAFAIQVFPVTHAEWLEFLHARGGGDAHVPRNDDGEPLYTREDGRWALVRPDGRAWPPDAPVTHVSWFSAEAYAAWRAERDDLPWRLPFELEWEKAARGVDGRALPWGDFADPAHCNLRGSLEGPPATVPVDAFPIDASVYGVRGLAGNSADWCADAYETEGPVVAGERVVLDEGSSTARFRSVRGGSYRDGPEAVRCASRWRALPDSRSGRIGVRLARSVDDT
ncbi:MAG: SUMF1/EgtB/PvdO family nonheme iron enzyme [Alphaproteobacteria bacterium]|nr:SUMF1/EgtB/PvdO family nonheme iron enzyme [Alphaproteobacteria bacterium]